MLARRLSPGDKLGIVAPSSPVTSETEPQLAKGIKLLGSPRFFPNADGAVLFLEAVDVSPEECDHLVQQLEQMDVFDRIRSVVVGHIDGLQDDPGAVQMEDVLARASAEHGFPILKTDDFGHNCPNAVVPIGAKVRVDADRQTIELLGPFIA